MTLQPINLIDIMQTNFSKSLMSGSHPSRSSFIEYRVRYLDPLGNPMFVYCSHSDILKAISLGIISSTYRLVVYWYGQIFEYKAL